MLGGLAISNWLIWIVMILFIVAYFAVTETINRREDRNAGRGRDD